MYAIELFVDFHKKDRKEKRKKVFIPRIIAKRTGIIGVLKHCSTAVLHYWNSGAMYHRVLEYWLIFIDYNKISSALTL